MASTWKKLAKYTVVGAQTKRIIVHLNCISVLPLATANVPAGFPIEAKMPQKANMRTNIAAFAYLSLKNKHTTSSENIDNATRIGIFIKPINDNILE